MTDSASHPLPEAASTNCPDAKAQTLDKHMAALRAAGAATLNATAWHYIEVLAQRMQQQTGPAQVLLQDKLQALLNTHQSQMAARPGPATAPYKPAPNRVTPLTALLQEMRQPAQGGPMGHAGRPDTWRREKPAVQAFRQQLSKISVQKKVTQAMAQAPQNAGPINSHMLVLRSLGLMRDISPDYLSHFMLHVDTLMHLDEAHSSHAPSTKVRASNPLPKESGAKTRQR